MLTLRRTVRLVINPGERGEGPGAGAGAGGGRSTFAGSPVMRGLGRYYEIDVECAGEPDGRSGYLVDIKEIDAAVRAGAGPVLARVCEEAPRTEPLALMAELAASVARGLGREAARVRWRLTPYYSLEMTGADREHVILRQQFDFAAAHRLHTGALSDAENRAVFGKCNNLNGHGHNYRIEPAVAVAVSGAGGGFGLADLERLTEEHVIARFDHKHLNIDTHEFAAEGGVNPTVENIARVCFEHLSRAIGECGKAAELRSVTVWETDRTSCTYPG
ncbi:MAG: 6-carboxytetrahydropterin synthase [Planctomycetota bacterium]|nr:6-carboxytetrahydropterin synthase [Planctomycetota bacterium]